MTVGSGPRKLLLPPATPPEGLSTSLLNLLVFKQLAAFTDIHAGPGLPTLTQSDGPPLAATRATGAYGSRVSGGSPPALPCLPRRRKLLFDLWFAGDLATLSPLQHGFACLDLLLLAEQILFMIRIFLQDQVEACALLQIGTLGTMLAASIDGADTDGASIQPAAASSPRAFGMGQKPLQSLAEFRKGKPLVAPKAVSPPVDPESVHEAFHRGDGF